jgi:hypothetical protein
MPLAARAEGDVVAEYAKLVDLWPVVLVEAPVNPTLESVEWFCARQDEYLARRQRFGTIHDMRPMRGMLDARARKVMGEWMKTHEADLRRWHVASATVTDSGLIRGVITAVHWISKPPSPDLATGSMRTAFDFVVGHLEREGVPLGAKLAAYQRSVA